MQTQYRSETCPHNCPEELYMLLSVRSISRQIALESCLRRAGVWLGNRSRMERTKLRNAPALPRLPLRQEKEGWWRRGAGPSAATPVTRGLDLLALLDAGAGAPSPGPAARLGGLPTNHGACSCGAARRVVHPLPKR